MIKAVIFDMDGVLIDADAWHFQTLNVALADRHFSPISWDDHLATYKGLPTRRKLAMLTERKGLDPAWHDAIADRKQALTEALVAEACVPDPEKLEMLRVLAARGLRLAVCSNARRESVRRMLGGAGILEHVELFLSNEDVAAPKPDPEIYATAFARLGLRPSECVIVEDSAVGRAAATAAAGILCAVEGPEEVNLYRVLSTIREAERVNVVIPAAGRGSRFAEAGYVHPKPLIDVEGRPMIDLVLSDMRAVGRPIVLLQEEHIARYRADAVIEHVAPASQVVPVSGLTEGAACTVLLAEELIDSPSELVLANSDQVVEADVAAFVEAMRASGADGGIMTFHATESKWSFAKVGADGVVTEVAEKRPISDQATVGIYWFRHGSAFVRCAKRMIAADMRVNGEFYVCPVFNELIAEGGVVRTWEIDRSAMHGIGTPEDLQAFLAHRAALAAAAAATPVAA
ncbi:MAG: Beta-phosphoglucomutase or related phosphatase, superfamily [Conexibacter sp.]|nr:Beta-phosphoglucomutase or related phosphatase, superfamily [Conexibacter sp.]